MNLPQGWTWARVDEISGPNGLVSDGDWVESKDQNPDGDVRLTQLADVGEGDFRDKSSRFMTRAAADRLRCTFLEKGDALIARMPDPIGRACLFPGLKQPAVTAVDVMIWRTDGELAQAEWFVRWINSPAVRLLMAEGAGGTTRQRIAGGRIKELELPLPPKPEQRRIVAKLDALTARLARARAELDEVPVLAEKLRDIVLLDAFASAAPTVQIAEVSSRVTKGCSPGWQGYEYQADGVLFVRSQNVRWGHLAFDDRVYLPPSFNEKARNSVICKGDVLLNIVGASIGRAAVATDKLVGANCNQAVCIIRPTDPKDAEYLALFLISPGAQAAITDGAVDVARANFSLAQAKALRLPWPTAGERSATVATIQQAFARANRLEAEAARARALLDRLGSAILAKAFRGELVPQDPNDEPASILLDRIRAVRAAAPKANRGRSAQARA